MLRTYNLFKRKLEDYLDNGYLTDTDKKTAFNTSKQPTRVGDFRLVKLTLTSANIDIETGSGANFIDLTTSVWHELNFYEDIYSPIVSGDITLTDTVGLIESFPIIGEEILEVSFSTAGVAPSTYSCRGCRGRLITTCIRSSETGN